VGQRHVPCAAECIDARRGGMLEFRLNAMRSVHFGAPTRWNAGTVRASKLLIWRDALIAIITSQIAPVLMWIKRARRRHGAWRRNAVRQTGIRKCPVRRAAYAIEAGEKKPVSSRDGPG